MDSCPLASRVYANDSIVAHPVTVVPTVWRNGAEFSRWLP
jgi:hypothetical protein